YGARSLPDGCRGDGVSEDEFFAGYLSVAPAAHEVVRHVELVEDAGDDEIDEVLDGFDAVIPAGAGGKDDCARFGGAAHVVEVDEREGSFAGDEDQFAALLEV